MNPSARRIAATWKPAPFFDIVNTSIPWQAITIPALAAEMVAGFRAAPSASSASPVPSLRPEIN